MFSLDTLKDYENRGLVKSSEQDGYTVWCYTQQAVVERAWDDVTLSCRGLVLAPDGTLVSRPFKKFFNHGEPEAVVETGPFRAYEKMDGSLIVIGNHDGNAVVSTKGSFGTWHSAKARELSLGWVPPKGVTAMFELIHPDNRIVIDYNGYEGLVLLGGVDNETGQDYFPEELADASGWFGDVVRPHQFNFQSMLKTIENPEAGMREDGAPDREGFVVLWRKPSKPGNRVKLKFAGYVALHGIYTGLTTKKVWEAMCDRTLDALYEIAPDELHESIERAVDQIMGQATVLVDQATLVGRIAKDMPTRKEAAEYILANSARPISGLAFNYYDNQVGGMIREAVRLSRPEVSEYLSQVS